MIIKPQKYRIAYVFNTIYYPFTYPEILDYLKKKGYTIIAEAPPRPFLSGARNYISGYIAQKSGSFIELNDSKKIIASEGLAISGVVASAEDIIDISETHFQLKMLEDIEYIELFGSVVVSDCGNPIEEIKRFSGDKYSMFDEIMGTESTGYSVRIVPKNSQPVEKNWFDISVTPRFSTANREYYVEIVYRKENNVEDVISFAAQLNDKISAIIKRIEGP